MEAFFGFCVGFLTAAVICLMLFAALLDERQAGVVKHKLTRNT